MATASRPGTERAPRATRIGVIAVLIPLCGFSVMNVIVKLSRLQALPFAFYRLWMGTAVMLVALGASFAWTPPWVASARVRRAVPAFQDLSAVPLVAALVVTPAALLSGQSFHVGWQEWLWLAVFVAAAQGGHTLLAWSHAQV